MDIKKSFLKRILNGAVVFSILSGSLAYADYNKGFKYYSKYIKRKSHITSTELLKILNVSTKEELELLFKDNGKLLLERLKQIEIVKGLSSINDGNNTDIDINSTLTENNNSVTNIVNKEKNNTLVKIKSQKETLPNLSCNKLQSFDLKDKEIKVVIKGVKKLQKKHKLKDLKDFLEGIIQGKIPAGC
jgi:hypothetical protein